MEEKRLFAFFPLKKDLKDIWGIDDGIDSKETFREVQKKSSKISKEWGIVTRIQLEDFVDALRHARENH